jgi:hypothetical protein
MIGKLIAVIEDVLTWATAIKAITEPERKTLQKHAEASILKAGQNQAQYLEAADPAELFAATIRHILNTKTAHFRTMNGGIPSKPELLGWTEQSYIGDLPTWKSNGQCLGWVDWQHNSMYLDANSGYAIVKKNAGPDLTITKNTLIKRLRDAAMVIRIDDARQRNTIRITAEGHPRQVIAMTLSEILEPEEPKQ